MKKFVSLSQLKLSEAEKKQIIGGKEPVLICYGVNPTPSDRALA